MFALNIAVMSLRICLNLRHLFFLLIAGLLWAQLAIAQNVTSISQYPMPVSTQVAKVKVHISRVNHQLLREDFPFMIEWDDKKIETWLSENLNLISLKQAKQSKANTPIDFEPYTPKLPGDRSAKEPYVSGVYRPAEYGRALVIEIYDPSRDRKFFFDGKGLGSENPKPYPHSTGLASFGEANREVTMSTLVDRVLKDAESKFSVVQSYFQFQFEFDMIEKVNPQNEMQLRAGAVFRQSHLRGGKLIGSEVDYLGGADAKTSLAVELVLRRYGITSSGSSYGYLPGLSHQFDVTNVQISSDGKKLYDFGGYIVEKEFLRPIAEWDSLSVYLQRYPADLETFLDRVERGNTAAADLVLMRPQQKGFIQPDPEKRVSLDFFGYSKTGIRSVRYDGPWIFAHDMDYEARKQNLKIIPRDWVEGHHRDVLEKLSHLKKHRSCKSLF